MQPVILSLSRLRSNSTSGCCAASAATASASSSNTEDEARSALPDRSASIALLRTILISHVIGPATEASNPPAPCHTFMNASCNTSSARSLLFNIRNATPNRCAQVARYTPSNAARSPSATRGSRAERSSLVGMGSDRAGECRPEVEAPQASSHVQACEGANSTFMAPAWALAPGLEFTGLLLVSALAKSGHSG